MPKRIFTVEVDSKDADVTPAGLVEIIRLTYTPESVVVAEQFTGSEGVRSAGGI